MRLHAVDLHRVRLPLVRPFRTSFGEQTVREVLVIQAVTDVGEGWGECAADVDPHYSPEFNDGARLALVDHLVPMLFAAGDDLSGAAVADLLEPVKGHRMAKEALEVAVLDAELRAAGVSLAEHLGGVRMRSMSACPSGSPTTPASWPDGWPSTSTRATAASS